MLIKRDPHRRDPVGQLCVRLAVDFWSHYHLEMRLRRRKTQYMKGAARLSIRSKMPSGAISPMIFHPQTRPTNATLASSTDSWFFTPILL